MKSIFISILAVFAIAFVSFVIYHKWIRKTDNAPSTAPMFIVTFDDAQVTMRTTAWEQTFEWVKVIRVCFKRSEGYDASDIIYVFTSLRPGSYVIPTEATGGTDFLMELGKRKLFPYELTIRAKSGELLCWPDD